MTRRALVEVAALARIEELGGQMTTHETSAARATHEPGSEHKAIERAMWALGDYHAFAKQTVWDVGPMLVAACGIGPGQRVLDVAAGTGNVALRAAEAGAQVVASDLTPENFEAGRREAAALGVDLEWVEADAEALPFADAEFDVVTSSFGAIFPPTSPGGRGRTAARLQAGRHDRDGQLRTERAGCRLLRDARALRSSTAAGSAVADPVGRRGARPRAVRRAGGVRST